jgi:hypothetical protein
VALRAKELWRSKERMAQEMWPEEPERR